MIALDDLMRKCQEQEKRIKELEATLEQAKLQERQWCVTWLNKEATGWYQMIAEAKSGATRDLYRERGQHCEYCAKMLHETMVKE